MKRKKMLPLIIEPYPENYDSFRFISLIKYIDSVTLNIIDNIVDDNLYTYVLDLCVAENVDQSRVLSIANSWYENGLYKNYPISVEFSRLGVTTETNRILKIYNVDYISRIIGMANKYPLFSQNTLKKKRKILTNINK